MNKILQRPCKNACFSLFSCLCWSRKGMILDSSLKANPVLEYEGRPAQAYRWPYYPCHPGGPAINITQPPKDQGEQSHVQEHIIGKIIVCGFCPFALLPFCPHALMPSSPCPCPRHGSLFHLSFSGYQEKTFFVFVFTFRFMFRYRRLS